MSLTRQQKEEIVQLTEQDITGAVAAVFVSFNGITIEEVNDLRNQLFEQGCSMRVIPKRLLRIAMKNAQLDFDPTEYEGQIAIVYGNDAVAPAKILNGFVKGKENIELRAGVLEGGVITLDQVQALATLPSREEMLAKLVGTLAAPMSGLVQVFSGVQRQTVYVLQAIADTKE